MALISCPECGKEISNLAKMCPHCGVAVKSEKKVQCPECKSEVSGNAVNCPYCGFPIKSKENVHGRKNIRNNSSQFWLGAIVAIIGYVITQIGTYMYRFFGSWFTTYYDYNVMSKVDEYLAKMNRGKTVMRFGEFIVIIGLVISIIAVYRGNITEKIHRFKWGVFVIIADVAAFIIMISIPFALYEAWYNPLLLKTTVIIGLVISISDLIFHKGEKRVGSIVATIIGGILCILCYV